MQTRFLIYSISFLALTVFGSWLWSNHYFSGAPVDRRVALPADDAGASLSSRPSGVLQSTDAGAGSAIPRSPAGTEHDASVPGVNDGLRTELDGMLAGGRYEEAVELYGELYSRLSEAESRRYREMILSFADTLAGRGDHGSLVALVEEYTTLFFKDLPALRLLAGGRHALKQYPAEIEALLLALNEAHLEEDITEFSEKLERAIVAQDLLFIQQNNPDGAVEFHRSLALMRPDSIPFQIGLARVLVSAGNVDEAVSVLRALPGNTEYAGQIDRLMQMAEAGRSGPTIAIPLRRSGRSFVVEARLNGVETVRLLVDTGATLTIIRPDAIRRAGIGAGEFVEQTTLDTVGGKINALIYSIDSLSLGPESVADVRIGSVEVPGLGDIDGLLGMNILNRFRFAIDQTEQVMLLTR